MRVTAPPLSEKHLADLRASGLSDAIIGAAGLYSEKDGDRLASLLNWDRGADRLGDCLIIPYHDEIGEPTGNHRLKPDNPRQDESGKAIKYESPKGRRNNAYFPPGFVGMLKDRSTPILLVEGEKKALAAAQHGLTTIGISGVWSWQRRRERSTNGQPHGARELIPDLAAIGWSGRTVYVVFDADTKTSTQQDVRRAAEALVTTLEDRGADAHVLTLPTEGAVKVGLDDYLLHHTADDLRNLMSAATPPVVPPRTYEPFPTDALPEPLRSFVGEGALALGCDPAFVALPALAVCAGLIGNTRAIRLKRDWTEPSVLWCAVVADSGTLKSPAARLALAPLFRAQMQFVEAHRAAIAAHEPMKAAHAAATKAFCKGGPDPGPAPTPPVCLRFVVSDVTIERLAEVLQDNPRGLLVHRDELAGWVASFSRYRKGGGSDLPAWLEMHRAETLIVDRKSDDRKTVFVPRAAVSITGGIQPHTMARVLGTAEAQESGLLARLLLARPPRAPKRWTEAEISQPIRERYDCLLASLLSLTPDSKDKADNDAPVALPLTPAAQRLWVEFFREWAAEQAEAEGPLAAALSKLEGYAARLALLHHVVLHVGRASDDTQPIGADSITAGITLARWFAGEARRLYGEMAESDAERLQRRLVELVQVRGGTISARELRDCIRSRFPTTQAAEVALDALVRGGFGSWTERRTTMKGGRPTKEFQLSTFPKPQNPQNPPEPGSDTETEPITPVSSQNTPQKHLENKVLGFRGIGMGSNGAITSEHDVMGSDRPRNPISSQNIPGEVPQVIDDDDDSEVI